MGGLRATVMSPPFRMTQTCACKQTQRRYEVFEPSLDAVSHRRMLHVVCGQSQAMNGIKDDRMNGFRYDRRKSGITVASDGDAARTLRGYDGLRAWQTK